MTPRTLAPNLWLWAYQSFLVLFGVGYLAVRLLRGRGVPGFRQRLGITPNSLKEDLRKLRRPIWLHCVSVGEVLAAEPLVNELRRRLPDRDWVITTVTSTGREVARRLVRESRDRLLYLPWDLGPIVRGVVSRIRPELFLCLETELWPVLFHHLRKEGVPVVVANGRISPKAFRRYLWIRPFMERVLAQATWILTQSPQDARRYAAIGAAKDRIIVTGNIKWEGTIVQTPSNGNPLRSLLGTPERTILWTAGSTHPGEESMILNVYRRLKANHPNLRLLIAPRHPERTPEVEKEVARLGLSSIRRTQLSVRGSDPTGSDPVILLDTIGELAGIYSVSDVVFVGGSLVPHGGHNLVEPASRAKPVLTGPHLQNFQAIAESLAQAGGVAIVRSEGELEETLQRLLQSPQARRELGLRASAVLREHQGATARTADLIARVLETGASSLRRAVRPSTQAQDERKVWLIDGLLAVPEVFYRWGLGIVKFLYRKRILKVHRLPAPVVSVGNLTWGGTGKTPLVMHLALALKKRGFKPAVLTRGYGGDEVELMRRRLDSIPVVAGPDRFASGRRAVEQFGADLLLLDDGFQQWRIAKDLDILAIDATAPFGNGRLIPRGTLREPKEEAARADWIVVTKANRKLQEWTALEEELRRIHPGVAILKADHRPVGLAGWPSGRSVSLDLLKGERICTLAGIARPDSFEETVKRLGAEVILKVRVRDHHPYTVAELLRIFGRCRRHRIRRIVTTAKDAVRFPSALADQLGADLKGMAPPPFGGGVELWVLEIALEFESDESELLDRIGSLRAG